MYKILRRLGHHRCKAILYEFYVSSAYFEVIQDFIGIEDLQGPLPGFVLHHPATLLLGIKQASLDKSQDVGVYQDPWLRLLFGYPHPEGMPVQATMSTSYLRKERNIRIDPTVFVPQPWCRQLNPRKEFPSL